MSFFKKVGKSISSAFKKAPSVVSSIFKKGENLAGKVVGGLDKVGDVLGQAADIGEKIVSNPLAQAGIDAIGGVFGVPDAGAMASKAIQSIKQGSQFAKSAADIGRSGIKASQLGRSGDLQGAFNQGRDTIEKAKMLRDGSGIQGPVFE